MILLFFGSFDQEILVKFMLVLTLSLKKNMLSRLWIGNKLKKPKLSTIS